MTKKKTLYEKWVNYETLDPVKKLAQTSAKMTSTNLEQKYKEVSESRGESAFVWKQNEVYMASVLECLGTKNLVADEMAKYQQKSFYDVIAHDTVAAAINDLAASGAKPLVVHAFWGLWKDDWLLNKKRINDFVKGWKVACDISGATWGGGETPSLWNVVQKETIVLAASAVGVIKNYAHLIRDNKLHTNDRVVLIKSNGINANGLSLARSVAKKLKNGYFTKISKNKTYGEAILTKTNIYAKLVQDLLDSGVDIHYISNITGHGLRKIMRARGNFIYVIEKLFEPQEVFKFIQKEAKLTDYEIYETLNMGQDYAIYISQKDVLKTLTIIKKNKFVGLDAGYIKKGPRQVIINPKNITYTSETLDLR